MDPCKLCLRDQHKTRLLVSTVPAKAQATAQVEGVRGVCVQATAPCRQQQPGSAPRFPGHSIRGSHISQAKHSVHGTKDQILQRIEALAELPAYQFKNEESDLPKHKRQAQTHGVVSKGSFVVLVCTLTM